MFLDGFWFGLGGSDWFIWFLMSTTGFCVWVLGWFIGSHCGSFVVNILVVFMIQYCPHCSVLMKFTNFGDLQILTHFDLGWLILITFGSGLIWS